MLFNINLIAVAVLFVPAALAQTEPGKCQNGKCFSLDFNGNPTSTFSTCPVSTLSISQFSKMLSLLIFLNRQTALVQVPTMPAASIFLTVQLHAASY
jgi:hypothetical protein